MLSLQLLQLWVQSEPEISLLLIKLQQFVSVVPRCHIYLVPVQQLAQYY